LTRDHSIFKVSPKIRKKSERGGSIAERQAERDIRAKKTTNTEREEEDLQQWPLLGKTHLSIGNMLMERPGQCTREPGKSKRERKKASGHKKWRASESAEDSEQKIKNNRQSRKEWAHRNRVQCPLKEEKRIWRKKTGERLRTLGQQKRRIAAVP